MKILYYRPLPSHRPDSKRAGHIVRADATLARRHSWQRGGRILSEALEDVATSNAHAAATRSMALRP